MSDEKDDPGIPRLDNLGTSKEVADLISKYISERDDVVMEARAIHAARRRYRDDDMVDEALAQGNKAFDAFQGALHKSTKDKTRDSGVAGFKHRQRKIGEHLEDIIGATTKMTNEYLLATGLDKATIKLIEKREKDDEVAAGEYLMEEMDTAHGLSPQRDELTFSGLYSQLRSGKLSQKRFKDLYRVLDKLLRSRDSAAGAAGAPVTRLLSQMTSKRQGLEERHKMHEELYKAMPNNDRFDKTAYIMSKTPAAFHAFSRHSEGRMPDEQFWDTLGYELPKDKARDESLGKTGTDN